MDQQIRRCTLDQLIDPEFGSQNLNINEKNR